MEQLGKPTRRGTVVGQSKTRHASLGSVAELVKRRIRSGKCERSRLAWKRAHGDLLGKESRTEEGTSKGAGIQMCGESVESPSALAKASGIPNSVMEREGAACGAAL